MRRLTPCLAVLLVATGCSGRTSSERAEAQATAQTFVRACADGRPERALELLVPAGKHDAVAGRGCAAILGLPAQALRGATVTLRSYNGAQAGAIVAAGGRRAVLELIFGSERWRIAGPAR